MRKTLCASVLVLALCGSALAGDISNPPAPGDIPSPPSAPQSSDNQANDGSVGMGVLVSEADSIIHSDNADSLTVAALTVLNSVLSLF